MPEDAKIGMELIEKALKLDPTYAIAHAHMAWGIEICVRVSGDADPLVGVRHARLALTYGGDDATALGHAGFVMMFLGHDFDAASGAIVRALSLNGSCASALYWGALIHGYGGESAIAEDYANRALRLSPFDPMSYCAYLALGVVRYRQRCYDDAAALFAKGEQANPRFNSLYYRHAVALVLAGRIDEAKVVARRLLELQPGFRIQRVISFLRFALPDVVAGVAEALRKAGLPE